MPTKIQEDNLINNRLNLVYDKLKFYSIFKKASRKPRIYLLCAHRAVEV